MLVIRDFIEMLLPAFRTSFHVHVELKQRSGGRQCVFSLSSQECDFLWFSVQDLQLWVQEDSPLR